MYYYQHIKSELGTAQLRQAADRFEALEKPGDLAQLLRKEEHVLHKQAESPQYQAFYVPKPGGEKRFIEHPNPALKALQSELNRYLQAVYFSIKPDCAHGFIVCPADVPQPRNIYTNALAHVRGHWFLNIDLENFFHAVTFPHVADMFRYTFGFSEALATLLAQLCCCNNRLPMGAPTSPVVTNFVFYFLDHFFSDLARAHEGVFTRYADDLTFSFPRPPEDGFLDRVRHALLLNNFRVNEKKLRLQGRLEQPEITGLCVGKGSKPTLSKSWLKTLKKEITVYRWFMTEAVQRRGQFHAWFFEPFRKSLEGQVAFAGFVLGKGDRGYQKLVGRMRWG